MSDVDEFLAHHGVLGMKWGHHSAQTSSGGGGGSAPSRQQVRQQNRVNKATAKVQKVKDAQSAQAAHDKAVLTARANLGKTGAKLEVAKAQYKVDKVTHGRHAAKAALNKVKDQHISTLKTANLETGKERADRLHEEMKQSLNEFMNQMNQRPTPTNHLHNVANPTGTQAGFDRFASR